MAGVAGAALKGSRVFAVLPTPIDVRKTQAVLEGAIAEATTQKAPPRPAAPAADLTIGAFRPQAPAEAAAAADGGDADGTKGLPLGLIAAAVAVVALAG
ncbi:MAG TPA: hypothetical protein VET66_15020, partial [Steroidobacteraceae bacterium]|nr:hypothetical protein [Steroidobacteraceae bacterium]